MSSENNQDLKDQLNVLFDLDDEAEEGLEKAEDVAKDVRKTAQDLGDGALSAADQAAESVQNAADRARDVVDDTDIRPDYNKIDFNDFEDMMLDNDDDDDDAVPYEDDDAYDPEIDDDLDGEDDEEEPAPRKERAPRKAKERESASTPEMIRKEIVRFWIFTAIIGLLVAACVLFILYSRGYFDKETTTTPTTPSETQTTEPTTESTTEPTTESTTEPTTESTTESTEAPTTTSPEQTVLLNYQNVFLIKDAEKVNMRSSMNTDDDANIIGVLHTFDGGNILEQSGDWFKVESGGMTGYVFGQFVMSGSEAEAAAPEHAKKMVRIDADAVNVRSTPDTDSDNYVDTATNGQMFAWVEDSGDFYKIQFTEAAQAYVSSSFSTVGYFLNEAEPYTP